MSYELRVPALALPATVPSAEALANCGQNAGAYEPWFWEIEYVTHRYLERSTDDGLHRRHGDIVKNLRRLAIATRDQVPSRFFQSSWYWYRKEHQTRLELHLRGLVSVPAPDLNGARPVRDIHERFPANELGDPQTLYRYTRKDHAEEMLDSGRVRIAPAASYRQMESDGARADEEMVKTIVLPGGRTTVQDSLGNPIKVIGDLSIAHTGVEYHVLCFSSEWDVAMFEDFADTTHCVVVRDVEAFAWRLEAAGQDRFPGWYFHHNPAWYFDPNESSLDAYVDHATSKDFRFAYQREYRFLWATTDGTPMRDAQFLELGSLADIAEVVEKCSAD